MAAYGGSRDGSRSGSLDNLDQDPNQDEPGYYSRQYMRNPGQGQGAPPVYTQHDQYRRPHTGSTTSSQAAAPSRYAERPELRRYDEGRPQDQYFPSRSHSPASYASRGQSPGRYDEHSAPKQYYPSSQNRSYSPARSQPPSQSGYSSNYPQPAQRRANHQQPSQSGYARYPGASSQSGYGSPQGGYAPSQSSYAPSRDYYRGPSSQSSYTPSRPTYQPKSHNGYQPLDAAVLYATRHPRPIHKTATKDGGYYNVYTDSVVKTKKIRTKSGMTNFLAVTRPWSKNHSNQPRDFMPLVIASIFFNPPIGLLALVLSCITKSAVTQEDWAKAGLFGRITFWMSIVAIITGIIVLIVLMGSLHNNSFVSNRH